MSVMNLVLKTTEHMPNVIDAKTHGMIDYGHAAFFLSFALFCRRKNKPAALAALLTGSYLLAQSLLTDYPLGAKPVISFETHGKMDTGFASASWMIPKVFGFGGTKAAKVFEINSAVEGGVVRMTDFSSTRAHEERMWG